MKPIDGRGEILVYESQFIKSRTLGIISRCFVYEPLQIDLIAIDSMIPIRCRQQELVIEDKQIGKTTIATNTILNQLGQNAICVYVTIGQRTSSIAQVVTHFQERGVIEYTIMVAEMTN